MKERKYYYTVNFTLDKYPCSLWYTEIQNALFKIRQILSKKNSFKTAFYVDILMMEFLRKKYPEVYRRIYNELQELNAHGVSMEFFLNLEWEFTKDIHVIDKERILDIFAIAKFILAPFNAMNNKTRTVNVNAIRIMNGKLQPFSYLIDAYHFIGIKIDSSIVPRLKARYYDYSKILSTTPYRFTSDPNSIERFGSFVEVPRSVFKKRFGLRFGAVAQLNILHKKNEQQVKSFLFNKKVEYDPAPVYEQTHISFLNPDMFTGKKLYELVLSERHKPNSIICLESDFMNMSPLSFHNLAYLSEERNGKFISTEDIIEMCSTTNNKIFK